MAEILKPLVDLKGHSFILGSGSPRRRELLSQMGIDCQVIKPEVDEIRRDDELAKDYVLRNSELKSDAVGGVWHKYCSQNHALVLCADTVVAFSDIVLEKPSSEADAYRMLKLLSGDTHQVWSGFCLRRYVESRCIESIVKAVQTEVKFKELSNREIDWYLSTGEPFDKAGAYGIQGYGANWVESISGSYTNVVGLPMVELQFSLQQVMCLS